jgi:hypothetical protein
MGVRFQLFRVSPMSKNLTPGRRPAPRRTGQFLDLIEQKSLGADAGMAVAGHFQPRVSVDSFPKVSKLFTPSFLPSFAISLGNWGQIPIVSG